MHALALEFTYLWKLNRDHWLRVWRHICMWVQLWTGTSALTRARVCSHTHTHRADSEQLGVFAVWARCSFPPSSTMARALSVFALRPQLKQRLFPSPLAFRRALRLAFVEDAHGTVKAWPPGCSCKTGGQVHWEIKETRRNAPDTRGLAFYW